MLIFFSLYEVLNELNSAQKNLSSLQGTVSDKFWKNCNRKKLQKKTAKKEEEKKAVLEDKLPFLVVFPNFFRKDTLQRVEVFSIADSAPRHFILAVKN